MIREASATSSDETPLTSTGTPAHSFHAEPTTMAQSLLDLQKECTSLRQELAQVRMERDELAKVILNVTWEEFPLTKEEVLARIGKEKPIRELLAELHEEITNE